VLATDARQRQSNPAARYVDSYQYGGDGHTAADGVRMQLFAMGYSVLP
jgi:hypothetical protein